MTGNIVDFERQRDSKLHKRKEAKVDALRKAFRLARGEAASDKPVNKRKRRRKSGKK